MLIQARRDQAMGKLIKESRAEVGLTADILEYYSENAERFLAPEKLDTPMGEATLESPPLGVLFGVQPWNFILEFVNRKLIRVTDVNAPY